MLDRARVWLDAWGMRTFDSWSAFLLMLFGVVGLCGLFASYSTLIPLERALMRSEVLDQVLEAGPGELEGLRVGLGDLAPAVLDGSGALGERVAVARRVVVDEQRREAASIAYRTRLMLAVVTVIAAVLGVGILGLARRQTPT